MSICLSALLSSWPGWAQAPVFGPAVAVGAYVGNGQSTVTRTAIDAQGYVYVVGSFYGTAQFGSFTLASTGGFTQAFVAKIDGAGTYQWVKVVEGPYVSFGSALAVDAAGVVTIGGQFYGATATLGATTLANANATSNSADIFVAQLDPTGNWLWAAQAGGTSSDGVSDLALDAAGNVCLTGSFDSPKATFGLEVLANTNPATTSATSYDLFVGKLTPRGTWLWARSGGGGRHDGGASLAVDAGGNVYLTGGTQSAAATFGPFVLSDATGSNDYVLVAKLDPAGTWLWAVKAGGGINDDAGRGLALDAAGNAYVTGGFTSPTATFGTTTLTNGGYGGGGYGDIFVAKLDAAGAWQWAVRAGGEKADAGSDIALDGAGRLVVVGTFGGTTAQFGGFSLSNTAVGGGGSGGTFNPASVFLARLTSAGTWLGAVASQGGGDKAGVALALDGRGNASLGGSFQGEQITLGDVTLPGAGSIPTYTGFVTLVPMRPLIASLAPGSGAPGQVVTVTGTGFVDVTDVLFNGKSAAAFTVQTASRLLATVPAGATAGPVSVRTSVGAGDSPVPFQALAPLATGAPAPATVGAWPNPARVGEPWQVRLAAPPTTATPVAVRNVLGQLVYQAQGSGQVLLLLVPRLAPGVYQLTFWPAGQPAVQQRVVVAE